jgi:hypothetical protein
MNKDQIEEILLKNSEQIAKNTVNISILMKLTYLVLSGFAGQVIYTLYTSSS